MTKPKKYTRSRPLTVRINRSRHLRGDCFVSMMRNSKGSQCCLGFVARQLGVKVSELEGRATPQDVINDLSGSRAQEIRDLFCDVGLLSLSRPSPYNSTGRPTATCETLMKVNDSDELSPSDRERKLESLGLRIGIKFEFFG